MSASSSVVELLIRAAATTICPVQGQASATPKKHTNPYGYNPTLYVCALFVALFSLSTLVHLIQALWKRKWYLLPTVVIGGCGEIIGWSARLWSAKNVCNGTPFLMQISTTIISPTFLAAANFIVLGTIIKNTGPQYSRLAPNRYAIIFVGIDILALLVQAIGGGMASVAVTKSNSKADPNKGGHVMLVGIIIQLVEIFVYTALAADFFRNYAARRAVKDHSAKDKSAHNTADEKGQDELVENGDVTTVNGGEMDTKTRWMSYGLVFSTVCLFIRAIYRTIELSNGWEGRIIHTQIYFNVLDGAMIVLSMYTINFLHPGFLLS
ncbi:RTA1-like protein [Clavulina sp. PMI_390]|nr:RTA1-like protein [Clavulina sp. PMI_390]